MLWSEGVLSTSTTSGGSRQLVRRQAQKIRERRILYLDARGPHRLCHAPPDRQQGATGALFVALSRGAAWRSGQARAEGPVPWMAAMVTRSKKEATVSDACMARNGYIQAQ